MKTTITEHDLCYLQIRTNDATLDINLRKPWVAPLKSVNLRLRLVHNATFNFWTNRTIYVTCAW